MNFLTFAAELKILSEKLKLRSKTFKETTVFELEKRKQRKINAKWPRIQRKKKFIALLYPKKVLKSINKSVLWKVLFIHKIVETVYCQTKVAFWRRRYFWKFRNSKSCLWKETPIEMPIQTPTIATKPKAEYSRISVVVGLFWIVKITSNKGTISLLFDNCQMATSIYSYP